MVWLLRDAGLLLPCSGVQWSAVTAGCQEPGEPSLERLELAPARQLAKSRWRMPEINGSGGARKPVAQWATKRGRILALGRIIGETGVDHREAARMGRRRNWRGSESRCGALMLAWAAS